MHLFNQYKTKNELNKIITPKTIYYQNIYSNDYYEKNTFNF